MTKPPTDPEDWSAQSEALFDAARGAHAPSAAARERVRSALAHKLAAASGAPASGAPASATDAQVGPTGSSISHAALGKLTKVGLGVALALIGAAAFMRSGDSRERTETKPAAAQTTAPGATLTPRVTGPDVAVRLPATTESAAPALTAAQGVMPARPGVAPAPAAEARLQDTALARPAVAPAPAAAPRSQITAPTRPTARRPAASSTPAKVSVSARVPERPHEAAVDQPAFVVSENPQSPQPDAPAQSAEDAIDARAELEFVTRINAAVRKSAPRTVLALCAEHERRWPHGMFEQEREGARAIASCRSKLPSAVTSAQAFLARYPRTPVAARVREECAPLLTTDAYKDDAPPLIPDRQEL